MSRTRLSLIAVGLLTAGAVAVSIARRAALGSEGQGPPGASSWLVTINVQGRLTNKDAAVTVAIPPDFRRQHIYDEQGKSDELQRREGRSRSDREVVWRPAAAPVRYRVQESFRCVLGAHRPTAAMQHVTRLADSPPSPEVDGTLRPATRIEADHPEVVDQARRLTDGRTGVVDQVRAIFDYVAGLANGPGTGDSGALDCLRSGTGEAAAKSRLFVAFCRSRAIPARVMTGLILTDAAPPSPHRWAEAWVGDWLPACPTYRHFGHRQLPATYLVVRLDDGPHVRGPGRPEITYFGQPLAADPADSSSSVAHFWHAVSLYNLPPAERQLARFLLLLPAAAVVVSVARVVIGVRTFGLFTPALLGLIFRDLRALPWGLGIFVLTVLVGWSFRRLIDRLHLLLIPRAGVLLTLIVLFLLAVVMLAGRTGVGVTGYIALFPLVILTHLVERFWTIEAEDGTGASFKTLLGTLAVAVAVAVVLAPEAVGRWLFLHPESVAVFIAAQILLGRYTGYRLTELYRFQDLIEPAGKGEAPTEPARREPQPAEAAVPLGEVRP